MKKTIAIIILIILICVLCLSILQVEEHASTDYNVLLITNESAVNGDSVSDMISDIGRAYNITVTNIKTENLTNDGILNYADDYTDIIIQDAYENLFNSNWELASNLKTINSYNNYYLGMPWKDLTDIEMETIKDKCKSIFGNSSLIIIEKTYTNLLEVKENGIEVANSRGALTKAGELTLACTYITEITKIPITGLTSYDGISDASVKTIVEKVNETLSTSEPSVKTTTTNTTNATNTTSTVKTTTKTTAKTTKKTTTVMGNLKADLMNFNYLRFKSDREPRLSFIKTDSNYLYIKFRDCGGIKCEHTGDTKNQPKVYTCDDAKGKNKKEITDLYRCKKADYNEKQGTEYVYVVGIPSKYIADGKSYFYAVGYDLNSNVIREYICVKRKKDGTYFVDRAPRSCAVTTDTDKTKIGFLTIDYSGVSTIKVRTIKDKDVDVLGQWDGTIQKNWSQVESVKANKMNVTSAITSMNKVSTFFKSRTWKGKNPKVSGKDGVYRFVIETKDAVGLSCVKTLVVNTTQVHTGYKYEKVTTKKTTKKSTKKTNKKTGSSSSTENGYWEVKNKKYIYHYKSGKTKEWTISEYIAWKKLKNQNVKALDPTDYKRSGNKIYFAGMWQRYYCLDETANKIAKKNGGSPYAITVDVDRKHESIFENNGTNANPVWEPIKSSRCRVGGKWKNFNNGKGTNDPRYYKKNTLTPIGLYYTNGNHSNIAVESYWKGKPPYWVGFGINYKWFDDGCCKDDYLHNTAFDLYNGPGTGGCIAVGEALSRWIYYNCGRGTPILIW